MVSDAKRRANDKWDAEHSTRVTIKLRAEEAEKLTILARRNGTTRHAVLLQAARDYIAAHEGELTAPKGE